MKVTEIQDDKILMLIKDPKNFELGFRLLMQQFQERIYWHVRRMVLDHEDANDVVQDVFVKVYRSIGNFEGRSKLHTWIYRIATNESITFLNSKKRRRAESLDDELVNLENRLKADEYFDASQAQLALQKAIYRLPEKQKLVFKMRYYEELSYKEIAEILKVSVGGLKATYHHAVKKVEDYIKNEHRII